ncbi:MAG TPA: response regulator [Candidatus Saccharimonadia bacterium]|nr:response regulator [Candidatus Saccharimonadia bacterium]
MANTDTAHQPAQLGAGKIILIAEDDPFISRMYEIKLQGAGFTVIVKNNGRDAFEAIKSEHPSLAVLDINMPELSGLEVLSALQSDGFDLTTMPVIVLTNSSELSDRKKALSYGAEYLVKAELTPREVLNMIDAKLGLDPGDSEAKPADA